MADFCFQCSIDMYFGPSCDLEGLSTPEDTARGLFCAVLCEGCGPCQVDHSGWCVSRDCAGYHGDPERMAPGRAEVYERARRWVARRSGPLGPLLRVRDYVLGTPYEPGAIHCHPRWSWWYDLYRSLRTGHPLSEFRYTPEPNWFTEADLEKFHSDIKNHSSIVFVDGFDAYSDEISPENMRMLFYGDNPINTTNQTAVAAGTQTAGEDDQVAPATGVVRDEDVGPVQGGET